MSEPALRRRDHIDLVVGEAVERLALGFGAAARGPASEREEGVFRGDVAGQAEGEEEEGGEEAQQEGQAGGGA